jgi:hypothetical protein
MYNHVLPSGAVVSGTAGHREQIRHMPEKNFLPDEWQSG